MTKRLDELRSLLENPTHGVTQQPRQTLASIDLPKKPGHCIPFTLRHAPRQKPDGYKEALLKRSRTTGRKVKVIPTDGITECSCGVEFKVSRHWYNGDWHCHGCLKKINVI